ncbi:NDP-hexose 2,3-dehydratase family protein [Rheinheimera sp. NSM]|uniref:NDP-hexose 2,3-dehydratase family protein n=1 Tax=Rheinheimera sp. NSM TaxID=3457884 RepID=UPI00403748A6
MNSRAHQHFARASGADEFLELQSWRLEARKWSSATATRIPLSEVRLWETSELSPAYSHSSGKYFSVVGVTHGFHGEECTTATAMIDQPEVGLLGLAVARASFGLFALVQAKAEPGTIHGCQISPTVQATRSNQLRAHGGKPVLFLELFHAPRVVLLDTVQSEHGSVFWQKRNQSMIVEVPYFEPPVGFRWVEINDLIRHLSVSNLIHSDLRTILALGPFWQSRNAPTLVVEADRIQKWLSHHRSRIAYSATRVPLSDLMGWRRQLDKLHRIDGSGHEVIGVRVDAIGREVDFWDQLMVKPKAVGLVILAVREREGALQALFRTCVEPGILDFAEIGPTVQISGGDQPSDKMQSQLERALAPDCGKIQKARILYDNFHSDEGGRFFQSAVRYVLVNCDIPPPSDEYRWCDVKTLISIAQQGNLLNIQARDTLAFLLFLTQV